MYEMVYIINSIVMHPVEVNHELLRRKTYYPARYPATADGLLYIKMEAEYTSSSSNSQNILSLSIFNPWPGPLPLR